MGALTYWEGPLSRQAEVLATFKELYERGCTYQEIGNALGCTRARAEQLRKRFGLPRRNRIRKQLSPAEQARERMVRSAKQRAKEYDVPFNIEEGDVVLPEKCPILGLVLQYDKGPVTDSTASLDRRVPELGYTKGNVAIISARANRLKNNATLEELTKLVLWLSDETRL